MERSSRPKIQRILRNKSRQSTMKLPLRARVAIPATALATVLYKPGDSSGQATYTIVRQSNEGAKTLQATETSPLMPGDVLKISPSSTAAFGASSGTQSSLVSPSAVRTANKKRLTSKAAPDSATGLPSKAEGLGMHGALHPKLCALRKLQCSVRVGYAPCQSLRSHDRSPGPNCLRGAWLGHYWLVRGPSCDANRYRRTTQRCFAGRLSLRRRMAVDH